MATTIASTTNSQIKHLQNLLKKASLRRKEGLYVVEGWRSVGEIPAELIEEIYLAESKSDKTKELKKRPILVADWVMEAVSETQTSQGVIAIVRMKKSETPDFNKGGLFLCCEHLQDPGNLGTIIRMSEAAGVNALILSQDTVDIYNPKVVRATMGAILRVHIYTTEDFLQTIEDMKKSGVAVYGAALEESVDYAEVDYTSSSAFIIGNEGNGMTEEAKRACTGLVRIPMEGSVESLNASVAAAVLTFEAYRQRRIKNK